MTIWIGISMKLSEKMDFCSIFYGKTDNWNIGFLYEECRNYRKILIYDRGFFLMQFVAIWIDISMQLSEKNGFLQYVLW